MTSIPVSLAADRKLLPLKPIYVLVLSAIAVYGIEARADRDLPSDTVAQVQFDQGFLLNGNVDLSRFEKGNFVAPGSYNVDIYVNETRVGRSTLQFRDDDKGDRAEPCFDRKAFLQIGVDLKKLSQEAAEKVEQADQCWRIGEVIPDASSSFDFGDQRLDLSIPQASLSRNARGYVSPEFWDSGVTAGMLGYDANLYQFNAGGAGGSQTQGYLGLRGGFNVGGWHFRHEGSYAWSSSGQSTYQNVATYVQRDLPKLRSQLTIGEAYTSGELFESTSFRGVRVASDDRMLPDSLRGYAPVVRGIAQSNAKVTIKQNGVTLLETPVAPGQFEINDLYATGYGGDLTVDVLEADGSVHSFNVPYAAVPLSLRPGVNRYSFVAGTVRDPMISGNPWFFQGTWQRGFTNLFTGYAGVTVAQGYVAAMAGGAFNTPIGAIGADITQAMTTLPGQGRMSGSSVRVSYAKNLPATGTDVSLAAYRYSTGGYFGLNDAARTRSNAENSLSVDTVWRQRNRASLTLSQNLGEKRGQLYVTASAANYWNRAGSDVSYSAGYNNSFRNIGYSVQATRQRSLGGSISTLYYASVTIPLGKTRPVTLTSNLTHQSSGRTQVQTTLTGSLGVDNNFSYGVTTNQAAGGGTTASMGGGANAMYRSPFTEMQASVTGGRGFSQAAVGARGAIVAHPGGVTLSQPLSETIGVIEAPDAKGTRVINTSGVRVDGRGYAVVPYLTPYSMNAIELDPKGTSTDVELQQTSQQIAPRAGSVVFMKFETVSGRAVLIRAPQKDGTPLPFGALVYDEERKEVGAVGQASKIFTRGISDQGMLDVKIGSGDKSLCRINYSLPVKDSARNGSEYDQLDSICQ
ncbi:fimbria/pilus outer membrane usher protein [Burkholderia sp. BE17]|uniref:fimbria/pilus outer membrane usher protein n=1 Tax=Burkholderia sp. BE17 TaxID=2656644 RepID=UPI00128C1751|nr:fimbria/pilus outer membrane usher protein [Burkholderia sp. BE17]MPV69573.1 fimbria/pilus outer membrane usher protein [Burkholderia sp. BE17]